MEKQFDLVGETYRIPFVVNVSEFDRSTADLIEVHLFSNSSQVLKYKRGGGTGYDGDIDFTTQSESNVFCVIISPALALKLNAGQLWVEIKLVYAHSKYPEGRVICKKVKLLELSQYNTKF